MARGVMWKQLILGPSRIPTTRLRRPIRLLQLLPLLLYKRGPLVGPEVHLRTVEAFVF